MLQPILKLIMLIGLIGTCLLFPFANAEALTETQVIDRLTSIPVFVITDKQGAPLLGSSQEKGKENQVLLFFLNPEEAQKAISQVKASNPELGEKAQVIVRSMTDIYQLVQENKDKTLTFQMVPSQSSLESARTLLLSQENPPEQLPNVPVFYAVGAKGQKEDGLLTLEQEGKELVPFFFEQNELENLIKGEGNKVAPPVAKNAKIMVTSLFRVLDSMVETEKNKPSPEVEKFTFIPSRSTYDWIAQNQPKTSAAEPPTTEDKK